MKLLVHGPTSTEVYTLSEHAADEHAIITELRDDTEELSEVPVFGLWPVRAMMPQYVVLAEALAALPPLAERQDDPTAFENDARFRLQIARPLLRVAEPEEAVRMGFPRPLPEQGLPDCICEILEGLDLPELLDALYIADELRNPAAQMVLAAAIAHALRSIPRDEYATIFQSSVQLLRLKPDDLTLHADPDGYTDARMIQHLAQDIRLAPELLQQVDDWGMAEAILNEINRHTSGTAPLYLSAGPDVPGRAVDLIRRLRERDAEPLGDTVRVLGERFPDRIAAPAPAEAAAASAAAASTEAVSLSGREVWVIQPRAFRDVPQESLSERGRRLCDVLDSSKTYMRLLKECGRFV